MNAIVIEHVPVADLPAAWRDQLTALAGATVTVRIERDERETPPAERMEVFATDDPAFGIWRDRDDMTDLAAYMDPLRKPRYSRDGSPTAP